MPMLTPPDSNLCKVYEFRPAPGQFTNTLPLWEEGDDAAAMLAKAEERLIRENRQLVCLGAWGGYITFSFDHLVLNLPDSCDFVILGNSFYSKIDEQGRQQGSAEPGVIYVSPDDNGDGVPDAWYEIAGSEFSRSRRNYSITYFRPAADTLDIRGRDSDGNTIIVKRNEFHLQPYYPMWEADSITFTGTLLPSNTLDDATFSWIVYDYGYADNQPNNNPKGFIDIDWAVDENGNPVHLPSIGFVRVQTGVSADAGEKGDVSTEISGAIDLHPFATWSELATDDIETRTNACKTFRNGIIVITRYGQTYNVLGQIIEE